MIRGREALPYPLRGRELPVRDPRAFLKELHQLLRLHWSEIIVRLHQLDTLGATGACEPRQVAYQQQLIEQIVLEPQNDDVVIGMPVKCSLPASAGFACNVKRHNPG